MTAESKCPFSGSTLKPTVAGGAGNKDWWPEQLNLKILHQHSSKSDPMGQGYNYAEAFKMLRFGCCHPRSSRTDDRFSGMVAC